MKKGTKIIWTNDKYHMPFIVDAKHYDRIVAAGPWYYHRGYAHRHAYDGNKRTMQYLHQFILNNICNKIGKCDHKNRNKRDSRRKNLRIVTFSQNCHNVSKYKGKSKFMGVRLSLNNTWRAQIWLNGFIHIGMFKSEIEAAKARDKKAIELFGKYARLNFPIKKVA